MNFVTNSSNFYYFNINFIFLESFNWNKNCKIAAAVCFILSLALFASIIPFDNTHLSMVRFDSLSEKEINDEQDFQK